MPANPWYTCREKKPNCLTGSIPTLVRVFLCPCVGPFPSVGLTLTWYMGWNISTFHHILSLYSCLTGLFFTQSVLLTLQMKRKKLHWTGFQSRAFWSIGTVFSASTLRIKLPTWAPIYLATVNISYFTGLHNVEQLSISQLAVWWWNG